MAKHIDSVANSYIPRVSNAGFYALCRGGDLVLCSGADGISVPIERETNSPFSHVLMLWTDDVFYKWMTLESTIEKGVHLGNFDEYADRYAGDLVLCRRPALTEAQIRAELLVGRELLGDKYDWIEEVSMAARKAKLFSKLPVIKPKNELYCSGLQQAIAVNVLPFDIPGPDWATPEQIFTDSSVEAICALLRAA
ncbi:MAG: hypothetical protein WA708_18215 [Acidobacteriaceae bacterium]